jgi:hypothetical protein
MLNFLFHECAVNHAPPPQTQPVPRIIDMMCLLFSIIYIMDTEKKADTIFRMMYKAFLICWTYFLSGLLYIVSSCLAEILWNIITTIFIRVSYMIYYRT